MCVSSHGGVRVRTERRHLHASPPESPNRMCGIAGLIDGALAPEQRVALVRAMVDRLRHRGPTASAVRECDGATLGLARLAIVSPESVVHIPHDERGTLHAGVNG